MRNRSVKRFVLDIEGVPTRYILAKDLGDTKMIVAEGSHNNKTELITTKEFNEKLIRKIKRKRYDK